MSTHVTPTDGSGGSTAAAHAEALANGEQGEGRYARLTRLIATDHPVIMDGATGTELIRVGGERPELEEHLWGLTAILENPGDVKAVHRSYVEVGCDVICTDTWGLATALRNGQARLWETSEPIHWMDLARRGVRLAREAAAEGGRADEVAVAFSINGDVDTPDGRETIRLLARAFEQDPPDLILVETLTLIRSSTYATVEALLDTGLPVWLSFRRCRHGVCGVYGEHWGGPEGDAFGRAARRFEEMGVGALALNCLPPDHVTGMLAWLRDFTDLPLGVYPNLGYLSAAGWRQESGVGAEEYAELALRWRQEGAQIVGGCCGVGPEQIAAARTALAETKPGHTRPEALPDEGVRSITTESKRAPATALGRRARPAHVPARPPRHHRRAGGVRAHAGELPGLEVLLPRRNRRPRALLGHRLRDRAADRSAGAERRRACARHRHRSRGGQEHDGKRISKRSGRPGQRCRAGSLPVGPRGALRRDRGQPLPDSGGSVRAGRIAPAAWTTGAAGWSTTCSGCCPRR